MTIKIADFSARYGFNLDDYQIAGCNGLASGASVLVAAPTGAGKTVVGEFAVWLAIQQGRKCFYTTPIKALSNQKFHDLSAVWGTERVGLLTGDLSINPEAQIVVMTTEVLRNMIYAGSPTLNNLGYVVLDEVHYLADRFRGAVWEEVILGLADSVALVALSATVSNVEEFGDWLRTVRGELVVVVSERRPVPLYQQVMVGKRIIDLFASQAPTANELPSKFQPKVNPELLKAAKAESMQVRDDARRPRGRSGRGKRVHGYGSGSYGGAAHGRFTRKSKLVSRYDMVLGLKKANLLPAICFIFSRQGCDAAVRQVADLQLTSPAERELLGRIADSHISGLSSADLDALDYSEFRQALVNGVAAHHAGRLPTFKAIVEEGFASGALKVVFATETLALGINMPAKTVVLEKLIKYNGESHADITPGEYTQLTGRAGRRGIDVEGFAVVIWQPGMDPRALAGLASRRTYPLRSSFVPTYNMAVNLIAVQGITRARGLLEQSFAQFQTDKSVVGTSRVLAQRRSQLATVEGDIECHLGDFMGYALLRDQISSLEAEAAKARRVHHGEEIGRSLAALLPGDVIWVPKQGWSVVISTAQPNRRGQDASVRTISADHTVLILARHDLVVPVKAVARVRVPRRFSLRDRASRRTLLAAMADKVTQLDPPLAARASTDPDVKRQISELRTQILAHPCHSCPDREIHAIQAAKVIRLQREVSRMAAEAQSRTNSLGISFDRIIQVLHELDYLDGDKITKAGLMLRRIYNELDLVACESIRRGVFDGLTPPQLAAVISSLIYESRLTRGAVPARMPDRESEQAQSALRKVWREVAQLERTYRLDPSREPDIGFAETAWRWTSGQDLAKVLSLSGLPAGDFVRWVRQVIDLAGQIGSAVGPGDLHRTCKEVVRSMRRGVIDIDVEED